MPVGLIGVPEKGFRTEGAFFELGVHEFGRERTESDAVLVVVPTFGVVGRRCGRGSFHLMVAGIKA